MAYAKKKGWEWAPEWNDFRAFLRDMGPLPDPTFSLDRIDPNLHAYGPKLVRWADKKTQTRNRSNTRLIPFRGERLPILEVADRLGMPYKTLYSAVIGRGEAADDVAQRRAAPGPSSWHHPRPEVEAQFLKDFAVWRKRLRPGFEVLGHPEVFYLLHVYRVLEFTEKALNFQANGHPSEDELSASEEGRAWVDADQRRNETLNYLQSARPELMGWFRPGPGRLVSDIAALLERAHRRDGI
ncbi:hypothetical protein [Phenylobacterium sp.]|uniref:hypothetical protein n=1 Tax=Phenylobacterium sp. TaxID=1871053 RepID=UPI0027305C55|nr:hypothetical protein [Phenylobacterium sp.]MDP1873182.1 hypothetical protein [Phenylobacterium sp.]